MKNTLIACILGVLIVSIACSSGPDPTTQPLMMPPPPPPSPPVAEMYQNPALGYSIDIPKGLVGVTGDQAGPERGIEVRLKTGGVISVYGEPNSLGWSSPQDGVKYAFAHSECPKTPPKVSRVRLGNVSGAKGEQSCGGSITETMLAFRPKGGPIYWIVLRTHSEHKSEDEATLQQMARTFKLIKWE